jgi:hypothetical protein
VLLRGWERVREGRGVGGVVVLPNPEVGSDLLFILINDNQWRI